MSADLARRCAFPRATEWSDATATDVPGMDILTYFAAHAPIDIAPWFMPTMAAKRPEPLWPEGHPHSGCERPLNHEEISAYDVERSRQRALQWPWAWAAGVLAARLVVDGA